MIDEAYCSVVLALLQVAVTIVKRWKLAWFGQVTGHDSLSKTILQGIREGGQHRDWQRSFVDNIKEWISLPMPELFTTASCRKDWKRISVESSLMHPSPPIDPLGYGTELN